MTKGKPRPVLITVLVLMHVMGAYALWYGYVNGFSLEAKVWLLALHTLRQAGITLGYHRLATHGAFKCHFVTKVVLMFLAGLAGQGLMRDWVLDHTQHHEDTDGEWDPHSPFRYPGLKGFLWAHIGWMCFDIIRPRPNFGAAFMETNARLLKWNKWVYPLGALSGFVLPWIFAGTDGLLLGGFVGVLGHLHWTWNVNSFCHLFGFKGKRLNVPGNARNNPIIAILPSLSGEGLHGNHHDQADCAFMARKWWHPDLGKWILLAGEPFGIFTDIKRPPKKLRTAA